MNGTEPPTGDLAAACTALSQPVTKLIDVVAQGMGRLYSPVGTILQAKADAVAEVIAAKNEFKLQDMRETRELERRAVSRWLHVETERQANLEAIVEQAKKELPETVSETPVPKDWINHFFSSAQDISDADLQKLWGRILASEVDKPGQVGKRTVEVLKTMDRAEAHLFERMLSVSARRGGWFFLFEESAQRFLRKSIGETDFVSHMRDIGILAGEPDLLDQDNSGWTFDFGNLKYRITAKKPADHLLALTICSLRSYSAIGQQLANVIAQPADAGFLSELSRSLAEYEGGIELIENSA